eukprot:TRINITY_DN2953_c1_g1_i1.p1 TRINITY_DN2953_c1_g1~~TRINITY_DN2953_c1_g1_i1.p1  ORF type:complete len:146 (+),score=7.73 TRINITY_DN2953_c1_g1_i1:625-1062(+)
MFMRYKMFYMYCGKSLLNTVTFTLGTVHIPFLILMGWTDGQDGQRVHFPCAIAGLGLLSFYMIVQGFCSIQCIRIGKVSVVQKGFLLFSVVCCFGVAIATPACVILWIKMADSFYEWLAVMCLFGSMLAFYFDFAVSSDTAFDRL